MPMSMLGLVVVSRIGSPSNDGVNRLCQAAALRGSEKQLRFLLLFIGKIGENFRASQPDALEVVHQTSDHLLHDADQFPTILWISRITGLLQTKRCVGWILRKPYIGVT